MTCHGVETKEGGSPNAAAERHSPAPEQGSDVWGRNKEARPSMWAAWCREGRSGRPAQTAVMVPAAANDYGGPFGGTRLVAGSSAAQRSAVGRANALEPSLSPSWSGSGALERLLERGMPCNRRQTQTGHTGQNGRRQTADSRQQTADTERHRAPSNSGPVACGIGGLACVGSLG